MRQHGERLGETGASVNSEDIFVGNAQRPDASDIARLVKANQKGDRAAFDELV